MMTVADVVRRLAPIGYVQSIESRWGRYTLTVMRTGGVNLIAEAGSLSSCCDEIERIAGPRRG